MPKAHYKCPKCNCRNLTRSRRRGWVERWICPVIRYMPFRCLNCHARFYFFQIPQHAAKSD